MQPLKKVSVSGVITGSIVAVAGSEIVYLGVGVIIRLFLGASGNFNPDHHAIIGSIGWLSQIETKSAKTAAGFGGACLRPTCNVKRLSRNNLLLTGAVNPRGELANHPPSSCWVALQSWSVSFGACGLDGAWLRSQRPGFLSCWDMAFSGYSGKADPNPSDKVQ
jgi:hypothetical protein